MSEWKDLLNRQPTSPMHGNARPTAEPEFEFADGPDPLQYRPWIAQRGAGRPALFIDFRRYEPKTGLLVGQMMSYPQLTSVDYIGDTMVSLDFGTRHYVIEGNQLEQLPRLLQSGLVLAIQEYSKRIWMEPSSSALVRKITRVEIQAKSWVPEPILPTSADSQ